MRAHQNRNSITRFLLCIASILSVLIAVPGAQATLLVTSENRPDPDVDVFEGHIRSYDNNGALLSADFTSGGPALADPSRVRLGPDGMVYVLDSTSEGSAVYRYDATGVFNTTFIAAGSNPDLIDSHDMIFGPNNDLYIAANRGTGTIGEGGVVLRFDGTTGDFIKNFIANGSGSGGTSTLSEAMSLSFDRDGNLYVGNDARRISFATNYNIMKFDPSGNFLDTVVPDNTGGLYDPNGMVLGPDGKLYYSSEGISFTDDRFGLDNPNVVFSLDPADLFRIKEFVASNDLLDGFPCSSSLEGNCLIEPEDITFGPDGNLYVASGDTGEVYRYNGSTGAFDVFVTAGLGGLQDPKGLAFIPDVPEPGTLLLLGSALVGLAALRKKYRA